MSVWKIEEGSDLGNGDRFSSILFFPILLKEIIESLSGRRDRTNGHQKKIDDASLV